MSSALRWFGWSGMLCVGGLMAGLAGCSSSGNSSGGGMTTTSPTLASGGASTIYAVQASGTVYGFSLSGSGAVSPSSTLSMPSGFSPLAIAIDRSTGTSSGTLYVGGTQGGTPEVLAYASGTSTPARTILNTYGGGTVAFNAPAVMAVDSSGQLYVASSLASVAVYPSTATSNQTPTRTIAGAATLLNAAPLGMAVDGTGNIYVSTVTAGTNSTGQILEFGSTSTGNTAPINKLVSTSQIYYGLAVDTSNNLYAATELDGTSVTSHSPAITEYTFSSGAQTTVKTITSSSAFVYLAGIGVDSVGNVYAINQSGTSTFTLLGFGPTQSGSTTPAFSVTSTSLGTSTSGQIAVK